MKLFPVTAHTDHIGPYSTFVAIKGVTTNGIFYIEKALKKGAKKIITQHDNPIANNIHHMINRYNAKHIIVENARIALAQLSAQEADFPAKKLFIYGITGTKGKTTTAFLLRTLLRGAGYKTALLSTVQNYIDDEKIPATLTTPQPDFIHQFLKMCVQKKVTHVVMEVSAQALSLHRLHGILFDGIIFTNFAHEHLEFYKTLEDYFAAKKLLFTQVKENAPIIINADDEKGRALLSEYPQATSYALSHSHLSSVQATTWDKQNKLHLLCNNHTFVCTALYGAYNASNLLGAITLALQLGISIKSMQKALQTFEGITGRLQEVKLTNGATAIIDYAHNPSSYEALLSCLQKRTNHLIVIFGTGGGKDKQKRPIMGSIAARYADVIVLTEDNPRYEKQNDIIADIMHNMTDIQKKKVIIIDDRAQAISYACNATKPTSIIAILGKGSDCYQEKNGKKYFFSDQQTLFLFQNV